MNNFQNFSENVTSAGDWQERSDKAWWLVGFVDGEGTFAVNLFRNSTSKKKWQCFPEFVITQGKKSLKALLSVEEFLGCGKVYVNKRKDNHREDLCKFCVRSRNDLNKVIVPFFNQFQLRTAKKNDFMRFSKILLMMERKEHLSKEGLAEIARIIEKMNHRKKSAYLKSSEAIR